jgi:hypothetical protein
MASIRVAEIKLLNKVLDLQYDIWWRSSLITLRQYTGALFLGRLVQEYGV